jgi:hypothetical protein
MRMANTARTLQGFIESMDIDFDEFINDFGNGYDYPDTQTISQLEDVIEPEDWINSWFIWSDEVHLLGPDSPLTWNEVDMKWRDYVMLYEGHVSVYSNRIKEKTSKISIARFPLHDSDGRKCLY